MSVRVGIAGVGRWGAILARAFGQLEGCELAWLCDTDTAAGERAAERFPAIPVTDRFEDLLADPMLDAVAVASPGRTHAALAERVLRAGKHCFVEKPLARSVADAERVLDAADEAERVLMVGHVLDYHPAVARLKELIDDGELGAIRCIHTSRLNLSTPSGDENALWALGAHDISIILALAGDEPCEVEARGAGYRNDRIEEVVFAFLRFPSGLRAHVHCSWINPRKERRLTVVGSRRMATFDDMQRERKLTLYDHDFDPAADSYGEYISRAGASWSPSTPNREPLATECQHFIDCVQHGRTPRTDGHSGLRVVRALEALHDRLDATRSPQSGPRDNAIGAMSPMAPATDPAPR